MTWTQRLTSWLLAALLCGTAFAQGDSAAPALEPEPSVAVLRARLDKIPSTVESNANVRGLLAQINDIASQGEKFVASRSGPLADLNARLGELGNPPAAGATEDPDVTRQRAVLTRQRNALDADVRLAKLLTVDAQQRASELLAQRRALFEAQLTERAASPVGAEFWRDLRDAWSDDTRRMAALGAELRTSVAVAQEPAHRLPVLGTLLAALAIILLGNRLAEHGLARLAARILPAGRLRRSLLVIAIVAANVLLVAGAAHGAFYVLDQHGVWGPQARKAMLALVQSLVFIAFVVGLGRALLSSGRPSWRLPPMSEAVASRLAPMPWLVALVAALVWAPAQLNALVEASFAAVVATHVLTALALTALIAIVLLRLKPLRAEAQSDAAGEHLPAERPMWVGILLACVAVLMIAIWVLVVAGYVAMASFLASQLTWSGIVAAAFYVLFKFVDDLFMATVSSKSAFGQRLQKSFGLEPSTLDQAAVVLSGLGRTALFFYMLVALITPLGTSPAEVFQRSGTFGNGLQIGEFQLVPGAIVSAAAVLIVGFILLRVLKRWLENSYLPETALEPGMRSSITTLLGYAGTIVVVAFAMSALGIGVNRIAWVASALSVGIGFGLQAIVQNFISGLILLAERPVKVGDWVVLGTTEGDVRRINVRATEIQLGDRSTLIVPNSEFITKTVRNMTLANAEGRVLIRLPMPLSTDAKKVRDLMLAACSAHPGVLASPAPGVTLEGVEGGALIFQAIAYVASPRLAGGVRSDLLFEMLDALQGASLPLSVPTMLVAPGAATPMATPQESPPAPSASD
ncbi:MAG: mechanosensitive ion channel family protein [Variovorax sp.]|nr:MAG: mechanosensitive ion channel family protein [Variovorax sp.]